MNLISLVLGHPIDDLNRSRVIDSSFVKVCGIEKKLLFSEKCSENITDAEVKKSSSSAKIKIFCKYDFDAFLQKISVD